MELERGKNLDYWNDVTILVEDELRKSKKMKKEADIEGKFYVPMFCNMNRVRSLRLK
jgi:hypothetical protein